MAEQQSAQQPIFNMEKIYVKDVSYEAPNVPQLFTIQAMPQINIQLDLGHKVFNSAEGLHEVVLTVTVTAKHEEQSAFLVELQQAGVFRLQHFSENDLSKLLQITCAEILFPYAREAISDLVGKGGFPQLLINPVNFAHLYEQKKAATSQQA